MTWQTVISTHHLRRHLADAWLVGAATRPEGVIVARLPQDEEPTAFGQNPAAIWTILQTLHGWTCINVDYALGQPLADLMRAALQQPVRLYDDVYYTLDAPVDVERHLAALRTGAATLRLLGPEDADLLRHASAPELRGAGFGSIEALLREGFVAAGIAEGQIVAIAHTYALSARYADIGVYTAAAWRRMGLSAAASALVIHAVQQAGRVPTWSTGQDNLASQRVADRLGFKAVGRRVYLIPQATAVID